MRIYLASRMARQKALKVFRRDLVELGHEVTSSWLDKPIISDLAADSSATGGVGLSNLRDIVAADLLVCFTDEVPYYRGGRDIEFGYALCLAERDPNRFFPVVVGPRLSAFHWLALAYPTFSAFVHHLPSLKTQSGANWIATKHRG